MADKQYLKQLKKFDRKLIAIVKKFLLLGPLTWPKSEMITFLNNVKKGNFRYPNIEFAKVDYSKQISELEKYVLELGTENEVAINYLRDTANSYIDAYHILQGIGTNAVNEFSQKLYGSPSDILSGYERSNLDIANYFLRIVEEYPLIDIEEKKYSAEQFKNILLEKIQAVFTDEANLISVKLDKKIAARAAAGPDYVKIRYDAYFSESDLDQLFHHEVMIHTLTYINGRRQPYLSSLGYNAPRTTATQEGLATFAEYVNNSMELGRLKRIALRIIGISMAQNGADLIDLFKFFKEHGQTNDESYYSSMRIFRGGLPQGGIIFYKDNVYLKGLIEVGSFLKHAMHQGIIHDIALLFCGKLTTDDVMSLKTLSDKGIITDPSFLPPWATHCDMLAAHLAINDLTERFRFKD